MSVSDARLEERFQLDIAKKDALAAFHHPFAYAADHSLGSGQEHERVSLPQHC